MIQCPLARLGASTRTSLHLTQSMHHLFLLLLRRSKRFVESLQPLQTLEARSWAVSRLKYVSLCWNGMEWLYDECQIVNTRSCHTHTGFGTPQHWQIRDGTVNYRFHGDVFKMPMVNCLQPSHGYFERLFLCLRKPNWLWAARLRVHYISTTVRGKSFADCQWWTLSIWFSLIARSYTCSSSILETNNTDLHVNSPCMYIGCPKHGVVMLLCCTNAHQGPYSHFHLPGHRGVEPGVWEVLHRGWSKALSYI